MSKTWYRVSEDENVGYFQLDEKGLALAKSSLESIGGDFKIEEANPPEDFVLIAMPREFVDKMMLDED